MTRVPGRRDCDRGRGRRGQGLPVTHVLQDGTPDNPQPSGNSVTGWHWAR